MAITLGQRLRALRHERGLILAELAPAAGISVSYLNDLEHDRSKPSLDAVIRLGIALGLRPVEILTGVAPYDDPAP
jgi:transcriptional regulator with XRE-family HTH domain